MNVYSVPHERTSPIFARAFALGCGGVVCEHSYQGGTWAGFGSPENWNEMQGAIAAGNDFYFGDHAYFGRGKYYRITKNAFFHKGNEKSKMVRIRNFYRRAAKWVRGSHIILCPQSDSFFRRNGTTQADWLDNVTAKLKLYTDRKIITHLKGDRKPLLRSLQGAYCIVSHSSNSAVEALMHGVPAINLADSPSANMTRNNLADIEKLLYPDNRYEWAAALADNQWSLPEITSGIAWRKLNGKI